MISASHLSPCMQRPDRDTLPHSANMYAESTITVGEAKPTGAETHKNQTANGGETPNITAITKIHYHMSQFYQLLKTHDMSK